MSAMRHAPRPRPTLDDHLSRLPWVVAGLSTNAAIPMLQMTRMKIALKPGIEDFGIQFKKK
jgi:hypothetical protein